MEEEGKLIKLKKDGTPDERAGNGGDRPGTGRKPSIEKLRNEIYDKYKAEFWVKLMDEEAIPRHLEILRTAEVGSRALWPAIEHTYNRALGKVKDSVEISGRLENLQLDLKAAQELDMLASKAEAEITKGYEQAA